jgi:hypothetical protein
MKQAELIKQIHRRAAQVSVGASAIRNQGGRGLIKHCRDYFEKSIDLKEFAKVVKKDSYQNYLDIRTKELLALFPEGGRSWGAARKGLNLFFREVVYNRYLAAYLRLPLGLENDMQTLRHLEVPLDKDVASGLIARFPELPKWNRIKNLTPKAHKIFQDKALEYATSRGVARVHLDLEFWRREK